MSESLELVDTHCHLNLADKFPDPSKVIREAQDAGVMRLIVVGIDVALSRTALDIAEKHEGVYAIVGIHPNYANQYKASDLPEIEEMLKHPKAVAIGEIGLDYHWDYATPQQQRVSLFDQLDLAERTGKPVVFHCREAYPDLLSTLEQRKRGRWLFHCFAGDMNDARRAIKLDCYFGVDGPTTYPKSQELRDIVHSLPRDRIVIETDAPFLSPAPFRGKQNHPSYVRFVNAGLAATLGVELDECAKLTTSNAERFFGLELCAEITLERGE
jgi:TatD DNase family protein